MTVRPHIPEPMKREIRQRCGFGCVVCGLPLYHYEHIFGYHPERGHLLEEITLLCAQHHDLKTRGHLPVELVLEANDAPVNRKTGVTHPQELFYSGETCSVIVGDSVFLADLSTSPGFPCIVIEDHVMLGFQLIDTHLLLSLVLYDERGNSVLGVTRNELVTVTSQWDMTFKGTQLTIRQAPRNLLVQIAFNTPSGVRLHRGRFLQDGVEFLVFPDHIAVGGGRIEGFFAHNNRVDAGIVVGGSVPGSSAILIEGPPRGVEQDPERDSWIANAFPS